MGSGGRSGSVPTGEGGAIPDISINGFDGTREPALGREEDRAEDAALPGRLGPTSVASGASSESEEDELEEDEDEDEMDVDEDDEKPGKPQLPAVDVGTTLFVRNVPFEATEDDLRTTYVFTLASTSLYAHIY